MTHLCISVHWLDDRYHGLMSRVGPPEWPPSPFRLFQALVASAARTGSLNGQTGVALERLQTLGPPVIIAPQARPGTVITRFVPNNDGDLVPDRQNRLIGKTSRPTLLGSRPTIHYLWPVDESAPWAGRLIEAARGISCFGWGIDMAFGDGRVLNDSEVGRLAGVRWYPHPSTQRDQGVLRVPTEESMADLRRAHKSALERIEHEYPLRSVDKPKVFGQVYYASSERPLGKPYAIFALRVGDDAFCHPHAKLIHVAGMTRRASIRAMEAYPPGNRDPSWVEEFVAGHRKERADDHEQFSYIPLPSIGHEHADAIIRRVMISAPFGREEELRHLADQLDGVRLQQEGGDEGPILERHRTDGVTRLYVGTSRQWGSVTPVILPGHDDHKASKTMRLIERALRQSGIEQACTFTWGSTPNFPHCLTAHKYDRSKRHVGYYRPDHLEGLTAAHLRLTFEHPVTGPLSIGAGRHCGLGVLAALI